MRSTSSEKTLDVSGRASESWGTLGGTELRVDNWHPYLCDPRISQVGIPGGVLSLGGLARAGAPLGVRRPAPIL
eukprot:5734674-Pyramimonas_sp.AAC.1